MFKFIKMLHRTIVHELNVFIIRKWPQNFGGLFVSSHDFKCSPKAPIPDVEYPAFYPIDIKGIKASCACSPIPTRSDHFVFKAKSVLCHETDMVVGTYGRATGECILAMQTR
jgi:hypothetical protein